MHLVDFRKVTTFVGELFQKISSKRIIKMFPTFWNQSHEKQTVTEL